MARLYRCPGRRARRLLAPLSIAKNPLLKTFLLCSIKLRQDGPDGKSEMNSRKPQSQFANQRPTVKTLAQSTGYSIGSFT